MTTAPTTFQVGHSPDPDDAFMFHAMTTGAIDTEGRDYQHVLLDIETLNKHAMEGTYEISAVSIHSFPLIAEKYHLMNCGASMGEGYGPMVISNKEMSEEEAKTKTIAIPGLGTSAYLSLLLAWGDVKVEVVPFDEILPEALIVVTPVKAPFARLILPPIFKFCVISPKPSMYNNLSILDMYIYIYIYIYI